MTRAYIQQTGAGLPPPGSWEEKAACLGHPEPDIFFADLDERQHGQSYDQFYRQRGQRVKAAIEVCKGCPVKLDCLETALLSDKKLFGIWGGMTTNERNSRRKHAASRRNK